MMNRDLSFDLIRIVACLMVVAMHAPLPNIGIPGYVLSGLGYIEAPCIGLFLMISGALLLPTKTGNVKFDVWSFYKRRLSKLLIPLGAWYLVGKTSNMVGLENSESVILWFLYVLLGLYLLTPVLTRWLQVADKKELELYIGIWLLSMCIPYIQLLFDWNVSEKSWIYYFYGYAGYFVLGHYLRRYEYEICFGWRRWGYFLSLLMFTFAAPLIVFFADLCVDYYSLFWYLSISVALACIAWWYALRYMCKHFTLGLRLESGIVILSKLTYGVYLIHGLLLPIVIWPAFTDWWIRFGGIFQIIVTTLFTFILSAVIAWLLSKIKGVRMIVGF